MFSNIFSLGRGQHAELVGRATTLDPSGELDWGAAIQLCDVAALNEGNAQGITKQVAKRLQAKQGAVCLASLHCVESLFKNGGHSQHVLIAREPGLLDTVKSIAQGRHPPKEVERTAALQKQAQLLIISFSHFARARRDRALRPLGAIVSSDEVSSYAASMSAADLAGSDWTNLTGHGTCGIKGDPKSYQEISPRAPNAEDVALAGPSVDEGEAGQAVVEEVSEAVPASSSAGSAAAGGAEGGVRQTQREPEIQALHDRAATLREALVWAERGGGGVKGHKELQSLATGLRSEREAAAHAATVSVNEVRLQQLVEAVEEINQAIEHYDSLSGEPYVSPVEAVPGVYTHPDPTEASHYVVITKVSNGTFQWKDRSGAAWKLHEVRGVYPTHLDVAKNAPHYATSATVPVMWREDNTGVASVAAANGVPYARTGDVDDWVEPCDHMAGGIVTSEHAPDFDDEYTEPQDVGGIN